MANTRTIPETGRRLGRPREPRRLPVSDVAVARGSAALLWLLIFLAAMGGLAAWLRPASSSDDAEQTVAGETDAITGTAVVVAGGFAERYVTAYLEAGSDGALLAPFLGYAPRLPQNSGAVDLAAPVRSVAIEKADTDYWSVVVAVGWTGQERFWQVAVDMRDSRPNAVGLPAAVPAPAPPSEGSSLEVSVTDVPLDDPVVESVTGFLDAYLCGAGELSRFLSPGTELTAADPALCSQVEVTGWGVVDEEDANTRTVVLDALLDGDVAIDDESGVSARVATYTLLLSSRDGRWEVSEVLPAPPLEEE